MTHYMQQLISLLFALIMCLSEQAFATSDTFSSSESDSAFSAQLSDLADVLKNEKRESPLRETQLNKVSNSTLNYLLSAIRTKYPDRQQFILNCSVLFDDELKNVVCDVDFGYTDNEVTEVDPEFLILRHNLDHMSKANLLVTRYFVDVTDENYLIGKGELYFKTPRELTPTAEANVTTEVPTNVQTGVVTSSVNSTPPASTFPITPTPTLVPHKCWHYSTGVYNDSTDQPDRYDINDPENWVIDRYTCLMWERNVSTTPMNWTTAKKYCEDLVLGGYDDWRLENAMELQSLVDYTKAEGPGINEETFPGTPPDLFWTSVSFFSDSDGAWYVSFKSENDFIGRVFPDKKLKVFLTRCVRPIVNVSLDERFDNTSVVGVVGDKFTGLDWERMVNITSSNAHNAQENCKKEVTGDFGDWRVPTIKALVSIVDYAKEIGFTMHNVFPKNDGEFICWSTSRYSYQSGSLLTIDFRKGWTDPRDKTLGSFVRCYRYS